MIEATTYIRDDSNSRGYTKWNVLRTTDDNMVDGLERLHRVLARALDETDDEAPIVRMVIQVVEVDAESDAE